MSEQNTIPTRPLVSSTRETLNLTLEVKSGTLPNDLCGYVYINTPNGTVNSALPYPKTHPDGKPNQEYSSPLLGGGGYIFKFDLTQPGTITLKAKLLKPPSYYADKATKYGTTGHTLLGFKNLGIARLSFVLGAAEQIATAVVPVKFKNDQTTRLLATADLGRAYEFNPKLLNVTQPIGQLSDYVAATPAIVPWIFKLIQGTAHPTFDPVTQELFTVNYTKSVKTLLQASGLWPLLQSAPETVEGLLEECIDELEEKNTHGKSKLTFEDFVEHLEKKLSQKQSKLQEAAQSVKNDVEVNQSIFDKIKAFFIHLINKIFGKEAKALEEKVEDTIESIESSTSIEDEVYLLRFSDTNTHDRWKVVDENGDNIKILQCMHQTSISKDYVLLIDAAFKLSLDVLMNNPFPNNEKLNRFLRQITTQPQLANTPLYIIKRADLVAGNETVTAKSLTLKPEFIHFTANYSNDNQLITIYTASNAAACLAEWVRCYDELMPGTPIEEGTEGILCVGSMDVGRVGKIVIDAETATIKEEIMTYETGNPDKNGDTAPHTWLSGFYTFRDFISAEQPVNEIKNIYWQFGALEKRRLTKFIFDLYKDYPNRIVPAEDIEKYSEQGVPLQIARLNTDTMKLEDYYQYPDNYTLGAIQFVPKKTATPGVEPSMDGYLFTTMINGIEEEGDPINYLREVWIFDASNLAQGPTCVLTHPDFDFGFTLHSLWINDIGGDDLADHLSTDIVDEYQRLIDGVPPQHKAAVQAIFEKEVFPNFTSK
ncbi:carotenoid oxygenase family protein [uncultured Microscilla sp.]|uniref:carotenoid oxygenase family protein n=1 Tax=uncultured Microscilla sp. TaxID=432653 RepID=UPI002621A17B|nr:carotenoid oxygenase family protein [uncultured Microscilla sp.]